MKYDARKENQFKRTYVRDMRKKENVLLDGTGLVHTIENLKDGQYVELPASLEVLPWDYPNAKYFIRRGRHLNIPVPESREQAYKESRGMMARIKERMETAKGAYRGYGWTGLRSDRHKLFTLSDNVEGVEIYTASIDGLMDKIKAKDFGRRSVVRVPSRKEERTYKVDLLSLPVDDLHMADILDIEASCDCDENAFHGKINYKYASGEDRFCSHAVAAYLAVAQKKAESENPVIRQSPIPIPSKEMIRFSDRLDNNVIRDRIVGKGEERATNVNKAEKEALLWKYLEEHGPAECFRFDNSARIDVYAATCYTIDK